MEERDQIGDFGIHEDESFMTAIKKRGLRMSYGFHVTREFSICMKIRGISVQNTAPRKFHHTISLFAFTFISSPPELLREGYGQLWQGNGFS
jgi:hypothetical protein